MCIVTPIFDRFPSRCEDASRHRRSVRKGRARISVFHFNCLKLSDWCFSRRLNPDQAVGISIGCDLFCVHGVFTCAFARCLVVLSGRYLASVRTSHRVFPVGRRSRFENDFLLRFPMNWKNSCACVPSFLVYPHDALRCYFLSDLRSVFLRPCRFPCPLCCCVGLVRALCSDPRSDLFLPVVFCDRVVRLARGCSGLTGAIHGRRERLFFLP